MLGGNSLQTTTKSCTVANEYGTNHFDMLDTSVFRLMTQWWSKGEQQQQQQKCSETIAVSKREESTRKKWYPLFSPSTVICLFVVVAAVGAVVVVAVACIDFEEFSIIALMIICTAITPKSIWSYVVRSKSILDFTITVDFRYWIECAQVVVAINSCHYKIYIFNFPRL